MHSRQDTGELGVDGRTPAIGLAHVAVHVHVPVRHALAEQEVAAWAHSPERPTGEGLAAEAGLLRGLWQRREARPRGTCICTLVHCLAKRSVMVSCGGAHAAAPQSRRAGVASPAARAQGEGRNVALCRTRGGTPNIAWQRLVGFVFIITATIGCHRANWYECRGCCGIDQIGIMSPQLASPGDRQPSSSTGQRGENLGVMRRESHLQKFAPRMNVPAAPVPGAHLAPLGRAGVRIMRLRLEWQPAQRGERRVAS